MSLCKPLSLSRVPMEPNRRNAQKSTGPGQGKVQSCLIGLRDGGRSPLDRDLMPTLLHALSGAVDKPVLDSYYTLADEKTRVEATIFIKIKALRSEVDKISDNTYI